MDVVTSDRLSHLVETVYGCVIEPDRWPTTMEEICSDLGCFMSAIFLVDLEHSQHFFFRERNTDPRWQARFPRYHKDMTMLYRHHALPRYNEDMTMLHRRAPSPSTHAIDEPLVLSRHVPEQRDFLIRETMRRRGVFHDARLSDRFYGQRDKT